MNAGSAPLPALLACAPAIPGKRDSDWGYAWVPVAGSLIGGVLAALVCMCQW